MGEANLLIEIIESIDLILEIDMIVEMLEVTLLDMMVIEIFVIIIKTDFRIFYSSLQTPHMAQRALNLRQHLTII